MGTAAKLCGEISHLYHADLLAVFFTEEGHSACLLCLIQGHNLCFNRKGSADLCIYHIFHLFDLLRSHGGEMGKVKTESTCVHIGACLLYMASKNGS